MSRPLSRSTAVIGLLLLAILAVALTVYYRSRGSGGVTTLPAAAVASSEAEPEELNFRLKWLIYSSFAPHFVALEGGYYSDVNLEVDIEPGGPGIDPLKLVLAGEADVGLASYDQILIAREKGLPLVAIGEDTTKSGVGFLSIASSGIAKPEDFVGRRVGVMPGTDKGTLYEALMAKEGIDRTAIEEIPVQFNLSVLLNGTVEVFPAFITNQPIVARNQGFDVNVVDPDDYGISPGGNVFFTSESILRRREGVLTRFLCAELRAIIDSQALPDEEVISYVLKHNPRLEEPTELEIWRATKQILLSKDPTTVGIMRRETWTHTADLFQQTGLLQRAPDLETVYTNDLVEQVHTSDCFED